MPLTLDNEAADDLSAVMAARITDGFLELYDAAPALLVRLRLPLSAFAADAEAGGQALSGNWFGSVIADGDAATFKITSKDGGVALAGTVSEPGGGGDLILDVTTLVYGQLIEVSACHLTFRETA